MSRYAFDTDTHVVTVGDLAIPCPPAAQFRKFYSGLRSLLATVDKEMVLVDVLMIEEYFEGVVELLKGYGVKDVDNLTIADIQNLLFSCEEIGQGQGLLFTQNFIIPRWT